MEHPLFRRSISISVTGMTGSLPEERGVRARNDRLDALREAGGGHFNRGIVFRYKTRLNRSMMLCHPDDAMTSSG